MKRMITVPKWGRRIVFRAAAGLTAAAAVLFSQAVPVWAADDFITWRNEGKVGEKKAVGIVLQLTDFEPFDESATFQVTFSLKTKDGKAVPEEDCSFVFDAGLSHTDGDAVVQDFAFTEEGKARIIVSGRKNLDGSGGILNKKNPLVLGKLAVMVRNQDIEVKPVVEECNAVDERGMLVSFTSFGNQDAYVLKAEESETPGGSGSEDGGNSGDGGNNSGSGDNGGSSGDSGNGGNNGGNNSGSGNGGNNGGSSGDGGNGGNNGDGGNGGNSSGSSGNGGSGGGSRRRVAGSSASENLLSGSGVPVETKGEWVQGANGTWLFLGEGGYYAVDTWIYVKGNWYRMGKDGVMLTGWYEENGNRYFLNPEGAMTRGWQQLDLLWYYMGDDGIMKTGWQKVNEKWYYLNPVPPVPQLVFDQATGVVLTDPVTFAPITTTKGQMSYGEMYQNTVTPDGYRVDAAGAWIE